MPRDATGAMHGPRSSGPGPGGEPGAQSGDVLRAEPEAGECPIVHPVKPPARIGEIPILQARVQASGEADHLIHAVQFEGGRGVHVIAVIGAAGFSELEAEYRNRS